MSTRNYKSDYFDLSISCDGLISWKLKSDTKFYAHHEHKFSIHFDLGCSVANKLADPATDEWYKLCLSVMDAIYEHSEDIKSEVMQHMRYGNYFPKHLEEMHKPKTGYSFDEAKAYVKGYADAVVAFKENFDAVDASFRYSLDKVFPETTKAEKP